MTKNIIRVINIEGIDLLFDIELMKVVCFAKQDNLPVEIKNSTSHKHFILERDYIEDSDVMTRLIRRCQSYKSGIEFSKYKLKLH